MEKDNPDYKVKKLTVTLIQTKLQLQQLTLKYNRLQHENKRLQNELNALKQRTGNG